MTPQRHYFWTLKNFLRIFLIVVLVSTSAISISFYIPGSPYIRCVQCSSDKTLECVDNPPQAESCFMKERYCRTVKRTSTNGSVISVQRGCVSEFTSNICISSEDHQECTFICGEPSCNYARSALQSSSCLIYFILTIFYKFL